MFLFVPQTAYVNAGSTSYLEPALWPEVVRYEGDVADGKFHGVGEAVFHAGFTYKGEFEFGTMHGSFWFRQHYSFLIFSPSSSSSSSSSSSFSLRACYLSVALALSCAACFPGHNHADVPAVGWMQTLTQ